MGMKIRIYGNNDPVKLIVGGLHGREWRVVRGIFRRVKPRRIGGKVVIVPYLVRGSSYISTLNEKYYSTTAGKKLLKLFRRYQPDIYLEIHGYTRRSLRKLTSPDRINRYGVPPFYKFNNDILIGCVSPHLFRKVDIKSGIAIEVPLKKDLGEDAYRMASSIIEVVIEAASTDDVWTNLSILDDDNNYRDYIDRIKRWIDRMTS